MIIEDLHGMDPYDAEELVHRVVGQVRKAEMSEAAEFIVGHGVLEVLVPMILHDYGLETKKKWGNDGVICCTIE